MTRWMIVAAAVGAMTGSAYGQASSTRAGGGDANPFAVPVRVEAEAIVVAQAGADDVPPPPTPAPARAGAAAAAPPAPVAPARVPRPPTPILVGNPLVDTVHPARMEKVIYLGAVTSSAPAAMREQLKLSPGVGLVVERVEPDTAAEKAGLKQHDLIEKLDDQMLINPEQLATLLRSKKAGDEVTLAIVRQGEHQSIKAKLEEKEIDANAVRTLRAGNFTNIGPNPFNVATTFTPNAITLDRNGDALFWGGGGGGGGAVGGGGGFAMAGGGKRVTVRTMDDGKQTTVWADDEVSISIERAGGNIANMAVKDRKTDKALYTGNGEGEGLKLLFDARPDLRDKVKKAQDAAARDPARLPIQATPMLKAMQGGGGGKVVRWQDDDHLLLLRMAGRTPSYLLALSKKDGHTIFDGPVASDADRQSVPPEVAEQFQMLVAQPEMAQELGAPAKPAPAAAPKLAPVPGATPK